MIRLHRRLLSVSYVSTSSALRLRPLMPKLQCRKFHNYPETCVPRSPFVTRDDYSRSSLNKFNNFRYGCIDTVSRLSLPPFGGITGRFYHKVQTVASKPDHSSSEDVDLEASGKVVSSSKKKGKVVLPLLNSLPVSKSKEVSEKKKPMAKKSPIQNDDVSSSRIAYVAQGEEEASLMKKSNTAKTRKKPVQEFKLNVNGNGSTEMADGSSSLTKPLPVKKSGSSRVKGKPAMAQKVGPIKHPGKTAFKPLYPPTGKSVVVVESVTKAKVIQKYLGDMYEVMASYGHVRDLAARSGSVLPDEDFSMVWEVPSAAWTHIKSIKAALGRAQNLILASDPDREGEAIAWHIMEMLQQQDALPKGTTVARVVFHEITESSVKKALMAPREIDANLVQAYLARRALDYLIGFNISPLLWKKLPGCQSAGRVQSAALTILCDRETEIDQFKQQEYWSVEVKLDKKKIGLDGCPTFFTAHLTHFDSTKLNQLSISSHKEATEIDNKIKLVDLKVVGCKTNKVQKYPPPPYITSTLQQDAASKLHFSSTFTMKVAQKLYEGVQLHDEMATGLITYMRTDGQHISDDALAEIRSLVAKRYGPDFAAKGNKKYHKKVKNAQEAHEAIRPTDISRLPSMLKDILDKDSLKLYTLIWCRTMACQMEPTISKQIQLDVANASKSIIFRSTFSTNEFLGYQAAFKDVEGEAVGYKQNDGSNLEEGSKIISSLKTGDKLSLCEVLLKQHHTQPTPRYSEASLVKKMEELGIGRPSTYASTLKVLQDRHYVTMKNRKLHPEFRGRMVSAFLNHHFAEVINTGFTADMETELDNISGGLTEWKGLLTNYWTRFSGYCKRASNVNAHQVEKMLEKKFEGLLFASFPDGNRTCPSCLEGTLSFKVSRYGIGYFIGCDHHPNCKYIAQTLYGDDEDDEVALTRSKLEEPRKIGTAPGSNEKVILKSGPYGFYLQLGEDKKGHVPKRVTVNHIKDLDSITIEVALDLLRYPVTLGNHPADGKPVTITLAKSGFQLKHRKNTAPIPKKVNPNDVSLEKALKYLSGATAKQPRGRTAQT